MATLPGRFLTSVRPLPAVLLLALLLPDGAHAQEVDTLTRSRLNTLFTASADTPGGAGLLPTAIAEARTALTQAVTAAQAPTDLRIMQRAAAGVLHALDPQLMDGGPGLGYGLRRALAAVRVEVQAAAAEDRRADLAQAAPRALAAAQAAEGALEALVAVARQLQAATTVTEATPVAQQMRTLASELLVGPAIVAAGPAGTGPRPRAGGLYGVQAALLPLLVPRGATVPAALRTREVLP